MGLSGPVRKILKIMTSEESIRNAVLRGIARNRVPGLHFPGNLLGLSFEHITSTDSLLNLEPDLHCLNADGQMNFGALALLADIAMAGTVRANLEPTTRLGTVNLSLQFCGAPATGRLEARASFDGFFRQGAGRLGVTRCVVSNESGDVCTGTGTFMMLVPPKDVVLYPIQFRRQGDEETSLPPNESLTPDERAIVERADAALDGGVGFLDRFWGYTTRRNDQGARGTMKNGPHVGNRVGHAQGGILLGFAAASAVAALPENWMLAAITAAYISPGEGEVLHAKSRIVHHGRLTSVIHTQIKGKNQRVVLDVTSNHLRRSG
jgi:acyl-coenzyme A thioesterase PaaI-like protein